MPGQGDIKMLTKQIRICISAGPATAVLLIVALWPLAQFIPPPPPLLDADWYAEFYRSNVIGIRMTAVALMLGSTVSVMFYAAMATLTKRMEGEVGPWTMTLLVASAIGVTTFFCSGVFFAVLGFRPERSVEELYLINDFAWIMLVIPAFPASLQAFAMGIATLGDKRARPILPRWTGYLNLWFGMLFLPGFLVGVFKSGPLAWIPAIFFGLWLLVLAWVVFQRIDDDLLKSQA